LKDIIVCTTRAIIRSVRGLKPREALKLNGVDVSDLVNSTVKEGSRSGDFFLNLLMYYCGRSLGKSILVTRCLYPYENRAWEKMFIQGIKASSPQTQIVGYQHASVAPIQANFFLGSEEADVVPLPDSILTTGNIIQDWLESEGNYPAGIFTTACALRQSHTPKNGSTVRRGETKRILVALGASLAEHINTVVFVEKAFQSTDEYELRVRPHPAFPIDSVIREAPLAHKDFFEPSSASLQDDLEWSDVVLYATSTVGLEAVSVGVPVVHLDLGEFLDTDPMFGWHEFKWSANEPSEVIEILQKIAILPNVEYLDRQKKGNEYAAAYLKPVTKEGLARFLKD
jgi:surface carbohydrate biosynthesis protein (TIGR04326 family)